MPVALTPFQGPPGARWALANGGGKLVLGTLLQQTAARLRRKSLTLPMPQLAAADTLSIPAFRYFWGSFGLTNLANQMRMMIVAWLVLDLTNSPLWVGPVNGLPGIATAALSLAGFLPPPHA